TRTVSTGTSPHPRGRNDTTTSIDTIPETDIKHAEPASPQSNSPTVSKMERGQAEEGGSGDA
ncbi:hypothetical protein, partial [Nocardia abscessus]|uniref:hypothetical protein n=1 Tax=Nocardia abscessus TaxID=120957 RepID=UPI00245477E7